MRTRAFTLLEVLISMAIFAMAAVVLADAYLGVLNSYDSIGRNPAADPDVKFARSLMVNEPDLDTAIKGGDFEGLKGRRVHWKGTVEPTTTADLFAVTFDCTIESNEKADAAHVVQKFMILRPTWSKADEREKLRSDAKDRILKLQQAQGQMAK